MARTHMLLCASLALLTITSGRNLQQAAGHCSEMSNIYNCFVGGKQMGSVCVDQCTNPRNPLFCTNCEVPADLCAKAVPSFNPATSTVHMGQGTTTDSHCPPEAKSNYSGSAEMQPIGQVALRGNPFLNRRPSSCASLSYQYNCVVGTSHVGQVCVPLCPGPSDGPGCLPCEDVRSNCEWAFPSFRMTSFITHFLMANTGACF